MIMAKEQIKKTVLRTRYRAVCEDDSFKGTWQENPDLAKAEASRHRKQSGNRDHVINIITETTISEQFVG